MKEREITALETALGYHFHRRAVIEQALTHSSQAREQEAHQAGESKYKVNDNEQLEFLGDAILALVTSEELFQRFPQFREGELSKLRAHVVSERHLIRVAQRLELGHYLRLGRGEEKSGGRGKTALLVDALEAVLAAIYLDGGMEPARAFILREILAPELERMEREGGTLARTATCNGVELDLTNVEFELLGALMGAPGQILTREHLTELVLDRRFNPFDRSLDMHVSRLRRKLDDAANLGDQIKTIRSVGYQLAVPVVLLSGNRLA